MKKRIICFALSLILVLGLCTGCGKDEKKNDSLIPEEEHTHKAYKLSDTEVSKDETVYVNLNADGSISKINVSDHLHAAEPQVRIKDVSELKDISDVKTSTEPVIEDGQLFWDMDSTDLYYNGTTEKEPPITVSIEYFLDGKSISPKRLEGKSGKVDMEITVTNNLVKSASKNGTGYDIYCPMIMAGGMIVPDEGFENVEVKNGSIIGDGSHQIVMMLGIPGMDESIGASSLGIPFLSNELCRTSYKISADVTGFSLGNIMFAAIPFSSVASLSQEDLTDDINGINQVLADLQRIMTAMSSQSVDSVIKMFYGDVSQTEKLINAVISATDIYEKNKPLIDLLIDFMSDENIDAISKVVSDIDTLEKAGANSALAKSVSALNTVLAGLSRDMGSLSGMINDLRTAVPVLEELESKLNTQEMKTISAQLDDSLNDIRELRGILEDSDKLINDMSVITNSDFTEQMQIILDTASRYTSGVMSQATAQNLAGRMKEWLRFGQSYDIFSGKAPGVSSTVMFVYKTAAIG